MQQSRQLLRQAPKIRLCKLLVIMDQEQSSWQFHGAIGDLITPGSDTFYHDIGTLLLYTSIVRAIEIQQGM